MQPVPGTMPRRPGTCWGNIAIMSPVIVKWLIEWNMTAKTRAMRPPTRWRPCQRSAKPNRKPGFRKRVQSAVVWDQAFTYGSTLIFADGDPFETRDYIHAIVPY